MQINLSVRKEHLYFEIVVCTPRGVWPVPKLFMGVDYMGMKGDTEVNPLFIHNEFMLVA